MNFRLRYTAKQIASVNPIDHIRYSVIIIDSIYSISSVKKIDFVKPSRSVKKIVKKIGIVKKRVLIENLYKCNRLYIEDLDSYKIFKRKYTINIERLKKQSINQLENKLEKQKKIYNKLKFIHYTLFYKNPMKLRITRKLIAQILTILSYKKQNKNEKIQNRISY